MSVFKQDDRSYVASMQASVTSYTDAGTGARHIHFATDDVDRAFLIGFPTLPMKSDGRAHVLEHLLLCGSKRYPVRDPFFSMMNRSLASFMNAMTYPDRTVYPFATPDKTDYFNLMDVYLDATFFPKLERLDFLQEGWRPILEDGKLSLQGVVLNEMKGTYADPIRSMYLGLNRALLPGTTYAVDSGGDPLEIPSLTHDELLAFHAHHYHPSQAVFMSWGDVDVAAVQDRIATRVLSAFGNAGSRDILLPQLAQAWTGTREVRIHVPAAESAAHEHGLQMAWALGAQADLAEVTRANLIENALLGHSGAVLKLALENAGFGRPSEFMGMDLDTTRIHLHVGLAGLQETQLQAARDCILGALDKAATDGVPQDILRSGLRDMRYQQRRNISGVHRLIGLAQLAVRNQDVLAAIDDEALLARFEEEIKAPDFVQRYLRDMLDTAPALAAHIVPDTAFFTDRDAAADQSLQAWQSRLSNTERETIEADMQALATHQAKPQPDDAVLPRISPADLPTEPRSLPDLHTNIWHNKALSMPTNGISEAFVKVDLSGVAQADWPWLDLYVDLLPQLGARGMDHQTAATWRKVKISGLMARCSVYETLSGEGWLELQLSAQALREEQDQIAEVLNAWYATPLLTDTDRLSYLIGNRVQERMASIDEEAMELATLQASAWVSIEGHLQNEVSGLASLDFLAQLRDLLQTAEGLAHIVSRLQGIHTHIVSARRVFLCAGIENDADRLLLSLEDAFSAQTQAVHVASPIRLEPASSPIQAGVFAPAQVNHCLVAWRLPNMAHADGAALAVTAELLQQRLLHPALREQGGAYGANAAYERETGAMQIVTYADPRLAQTYQDIQTCLRQLQTQDFSSEALEEAILSVMKQLEPPSRGVADLQLAWSAARQGISHAHRRLFREKVLSCTLTEVRRVASKYLDLSLAHRAAGVGWLDQDLAGLSVLNIQDHLARIGLNS
jgi:Zn-dependent M16 (insulinase) family peptidase